MPEKKKFWRIAYTLWIRGERDSRSPGEERDLDSLEECKQAFSRIPVNRQRGYTIQCATAHGDRMEKGWIF